jgi:hypothetical protein
LSAAASQRRVRGTQHRRRDAEQVAAREVTSDHYRIDRPNGVGDSVREVEHMLARVCRELQRDQNANGAGRHRREVAERRGHGAITDLAI